MASSEWEEEPLDEADRNALQQDLEDVSVLRQLLGPKGLRGAVFYCPDCDEDHYLTWELLAGNLAQLLKEGDSPVHEPAFDPDPDAYVSWDYARGFLDGYESFQYEELAVKLRQALEALGRPADEVKALFARLEIPDPDAPRPSEE